MKRILALVLCVCMCLGVLAGCGGKDRVLYSDIDFKDYVTLGEYSKMEVDTNADEYKEYYNGVIDKDISGYNLYVVETEGTVENGETANINYVGKKDGVAFEGGTASDYDLTIGSGTFIDGFEEGLIGVAIGDTVNLNLTFPENYGSTELAGEDVVFTVTINFVTTTTAREPQDYYKEIGYDSLEAYEENVKERAIKNYLFNEIFEASEIKGYPENDKVKIKDAVIAYNDKFYTDNYQMSLEEALSASGMTLESYEEQLLTESIPAMMKSQLIFYMILDEQKLEINKKVLAEQTLGQEALDESSAVEMIVLDWLYDNANIK